MSQGEKCFDTLILYTTSELRLNPRDFLGMPLLEPSHIPMQYRLVIVYVSGFFKVYWLYFEMC